MTDRSTPGYQPIDCGVHDRYEAAAVRRTTVWVEWTDGDGAVRVTSGVIADILVRGGAEFLVMDDGCEIRLDFISSSSLVADPLA